MFAHLVLILVAFTLWGTTTGGDTNEEFEVAGTELIKDILKAAWKEGKFSFIKSIKDIEEINNFNVTLVACQNVYNDDKTLKEIKTIELRLPKKINKEVKHDKNNNDDDSDDDDMYGKLEELKKFFGNMNTVELPMKVSSEEYDEDGTLTTELFLKKDLLYARNDEFSLLNTTLYDSEQDVNQYLQFTSNHAIPRQVLWYDANGKFIEARSVTSPSIMIYVTEINNADHKMIEEATIVFASVLVAYPKNIPKLLTQKMEEKFPKFFWNVAMDFDDYYVNRDVVIKMRNNLPEVGNTKETYTLFGSSI